MKKANMVIREQAAQAGVYLWQVAARLNLNDGNFSRKLRMELPAEEQERILEIIAELAREAKDGIQL